MFFIEVTCFSFHLSLFYQIDFCKFGEDLIRNMINTVIILKYSC